jgi:hypothetical protein
MPAETGLLREIRFLLHLLLPTTWKHVRERNSALHRPAWQSCSASIRPHRHQIPLSEAWKIRHPQTCIRARAALLALLPRLRRATRNPSQWPRFPVLVPGLSPSKNPPELLLATSHRPAHCPFRAVENFLPACRAYGGRQAAQHGRRRQDDFPKAKEVVGMLEEFRRQHALSHFHLKMIFEAASCLIVERLITHVGVRLPRKRNWWSSRAGHTMISTTSRNLCHRPSPS